MFKINSNSCKLVYKCRQKFLIIQTNNNIYKILVPSFISISKKNHFIEIRIARSLTNPEEKTYKCFCYRLERIDKIINQTKTNYKKEVIIKGLGFKANIEKDVLILKLGYSHLLHEKVTKDIQITIKNNVLICESKNKETLGIFVARLTALKKPDSYKGKGLWQKYENRTLKEIKKK